MLVLLVTIEGRTGSLVGLLVLAGCGCEGEVWACGKGSGRRREGSRHR